MEVKKILKVVNYKAGYQVRTEIIDGKQFGGEDFEMKSAYSVLDGGYIGNQKDAHRICKKRGIKPERSNPSHNVCSIGFNEAEQKWYGWSHRAMYGFGVGSKVEKGDCAFLPSSREEYIESLKGWYNDEMYKNLKIEVQEDGIHIFYDIVRDKPKKPRKPRASRISQETDGKLYEIGTCGRVPDAMEGELPRFPAIAEIVGDKEIIHTHSVEPLDIEYGKEYGKGEWTALTLEDARQMAIDFAESVG